jgi:hypothetical protein
MCSTEAQIELELRRMLTRKEAGVGMYSDDKA